MTDKAISRKMRAIVSGPNLVGLRYDTNCNETSNDTFN